MAAKLGTAHHKAKLDADKVREIRAWKAEGMSYMDICERMDWFVAPATVAAIITGKTWRHVE